MKKTKRFIVEGRHIEAGYDWEVFGNFPTRQEAKEYICQRRERVNLIELRPEFRITVSGG